MPSDDGASPRIYYDCLKCPAYCCSYERIIVGERDLKRLARHFDLDVETARRRFTKVRDKEQVLRHQKDKIYGSVCMFLDTKTRRCTVYDARPGGLPRVPRPAALRVLRFSSMGAPTPG